MSEGIGFILSDVSRLLRRRFDERARLIGITRAQWRALTTVSRREGITQGKLADLLEVEPITLCRMIDRLEEAGHIERRRDPADRRAWNLFLTERSRPLIDQLRGIGDEVVGIALAGFDDGERAALTGALDRIRDNLTVSDHKDHAAHG